MSPGLTLAYLASAALAFVVAAGALPWLASDLAGHYYHPRVLALTHTITLGWITLTIMGASHQLIPTVLQRPLWSPGLARWQLPIMIVGVAGMVAHFWIAELPGLVWAAALVTVGIAGHVLNIGVTLAGVRPWSFAAVMFAFALLGIAATAAAGLALALDHVVAFLPLPFFPRLHAHFHLALLGWVLPMTLGVSARVYPMFLLASAPAPASMKLQAAGVLVGAPLVVAGILDHPVAEFIGALAVITAAGAHLVSVAGMARTRRRRELDWGLRFVLTGAAFLPPAALLGLAFSLGVASGPRLGLAYGTLVLGGWVSLTIVGMLLKIVPFLVWYRQYAGLAGRVAVPTLGQLSVPRGEGLTYALLTGGMVALVAGLAVGDFTAIRVAGAVVASGALLLVATLARILGHLRPRRDRAPYAQAAGRAR
jgi:hypothetical protein